MNLLSEPLCSQWLSGGKLGTELASQSLAMTIRDFHFKNLKSLIAILKSVFKSLQILSELKAIKLNISVIRFLTGFQKRQVIDFQLNTRRKILTGFDLVWL
jgi:hypothetical protein